MNIDMRKFYHQGLNFSERIYELPYTNTGEATAAALRTNTPKSGIQRILRAIYIGATHGFGEGNRLGRALDTPSAMLISFRALSARDLIARQQGFRTALESCGLYTFFTTSFYVTPLVGTGLKKTYDPDSDTLRYGSMFSAVGRYGLLGLMTELPLYKLAGSSHQSVAKVALVLACAARLVLEVPRALLTAAATALWVGVPAVVGAFWGATLNGVHALGSRKAPEFLYASGKHSLDGQDV